MKNRYKLIAIALILIMGIAFTNISASIIDGEKLTFNIRYGVINAAEAVLEIKSSNLGNTPVWLISSNAKTYSFFDSMFKVRDTVESWWEKENLRSLKFSKRLNEGKYQQHRIHTYNHADKTSTYRRWDFKRKYFKDSVITIPENTQDILSAFYYTRQQNLVPGSRLYMDVTTDGKSYKIQVVVHRRETIDSIFGKKECLVIEPLLRGESIFKQTGRILIWVTDDAYKVPLKMNSKIIFGSFTATLKDAEKAPYPIVNS